MDSHILNMYHQARYRTIGHKVMRSTSNSMSSESSSHNSPEYKIQAFREGFSGGQDWCIENNQVNTTQSSHDTSSDDEEENIEVREVPLVDVAPDSNTTTTEVETYEDCSLVEGDDYDVIQVYAVHPDLDLEEASSEDDVEREEHSDGEYVNVDDTNYTDHTYERPENRHPDVIHEGININLDAPVVSNVDEYFIKDTKNILETKDEPVVRDVDEYFIKEVDNHESPNVEDFFIKRKYPDDQPFRIDQPVPTVPDTVPDNFLADDKEEKDEPEIDPEPEIEPEPEQENAEVSLNESDLEVLPNIEVLKKYLLEDMTCSKLKTVQRSCSVPHSPMNICMDIDDAKTCLSFEDLNLDLSDLAFDNDKDKSDGNGNKSDDIPRTLTDEDVNSFLITNKTEALKNEDDLSTQDMEIEQPLETTIDCVPDITIVKPEIQRTSTPIPKPAVLEYCIEKAAIKTEPVINDIKTEIDDFVDVESCNDTVIPVLEANNLSSLLEQFEATEKLNPKKRPLFKVEEQKVTSVPKTSLTNGMRLQDAVVQLNKNKMRQILMPPTIKSVGRSPSPVHSDHDYCSSKKRHSLPNLKKGQSLLKPEVLSSNNRILNSRHRSCKNKKIVYNLSSDDESDKCINNNKNKKNEKLNRDDSDVKKKNSVKPLVKPVVLPAARKKLSNDIVEIDDSVKNYSVMNKSACKASDNPCSQNSNGSIKLTIKNKSEVILNCDDKDSQKDIKSIDKNKPSSVSDKTSTSVKSKPVKETVIPKDKEIKELDSNKSKPINSSENHCASVKIKEEPKSKDENFYTALFSNKQDVQIPQSMQIKSEKLLFEEELQRISEETIKKELEQPAKKKKLNLQEYKLRRVNSNNSSATVSPESIFPEMPHLNLDKTVKPAIQTAPATKAAEETPKEVFDPIREASRKIIMITKKQKAEAMRKRDEDIVMSKIPKVENLQLQPLMTDAEMMKMVGMTEEQPTPIEKTIAVSEQPEKPQAPSDYEEIILVSVGTNTDKKIFKQMEKAAKSARVAKTVKSKSVSPPVDAKSLINFKIKKTDHVLKQNVFDSVKTDKKSPVDEKKHAEPKIDRERYKDITAALKSVEKHVNTKISSNSLFASIQDAVLKKAPEENEHKSSKPSSPTEKQASFEYVKTTIVREYDAKADHGEDKIILHLEKDRRKPVAASIVIQTESVPEYAQLSVLSAQMKEKVIRKRNDSDMSMSSEDSPVRTKELKTPAKTDNRVAAKPKADIRQEKRSLSKEKRSRSKERHDKYRRRSRSPSRGRRRRRSYTRSRSRSRGRYRRYRRSDSPYKRKRRSRSPYRRRSSSRRSPKRRDRSNRSRTPRRDESTPARSPAPKKSKPSPHSIEKKIPAKSMTPPLRKPTVSESSDSSTSSSSSSSSADSRNSRDSRKSTRSSCSPYKREDPYRNKYRSFSSEDRESNTPVEERRIVFVGKLEKDINKTTLRGLFSKFGHVMEVRLHSKEDGSRYGFVTYKHARDAWSAVGAAGAFPQYDVGFGGRRAFCRQTYADLDGLEAKYTESAFHGLAPPTRRSQPLSFEEMLLEMKKKLSQRKTDKKRPDDKP